MDFLELFFGLMGRLLLGWGPSVSYETGTTAVREKGGHQIDPDG